MKIYVPTGQRAKHSAKTTIKIKSKKTKSVAKPTLNLSELHKDHSHGVKQFLQTHIIGGD